MTFEERYRKISSQVSEEHVDFWEFKRLIDGELSHVGDWIAEGDEYVIINGTKRATNNVGFNRGVKDYTRAPRTMLVNGIEVPAAESEEPEMGAPFWFPSALNDDGICDGKWYGRHHEKNLLKRGTVHLSKANGLAHSSALGWTK